MIDLLSRDKLQEYADSVAGAKGQRCPTVLDLLTVPYDPYVGREKTEGLSTTALSVSTRLNFS